MDDERMTDEFARFREMISQYELGLAFRRQRVEVYRYRLGRLDQKLGGSNEN